MKFVCVWQNQNNNDNNNIDVLPGLYQQKNSLVTLAQSKKWRVSVLSAACTQIYTILHNRGNKN